MTTGLGWSEVLGLTCNRFAFKLLPETSSETIVYKNSFSLLGKQIASLTVESFDMITPSSTNACYGPTSRHTIITDDNLSYIY